MDLVISSELLAAAWAWFFRVPVFTVRIIKGKTRRRLLLRLRNESVERNVL